MRDKPAEPVQLVLELRPWCRVAVRQIEAADEDALNGRLNVSAVQVKRVTRQPASRFHGSGITGQDRNTIPALLTVPDGAVAGALDRSDRKAFVRRFQLLQADHIRCCLLQPAQEDWQATIDAVDVVSGDFHLRRPCWFPDGPAECCRHSWKLVAAGSAIIR